MFTVQLPALRAKRRNNYSSQNAVIPLPFPNVPSSNSNSTHTCFLGTLKPDCVEINENSEELYKKGYFGKRVSDSLQENPEASLEQNSKNEVGTEKASLILAFEEAFFLCFALGCLVVKDKDDKLNVEQFWQKLLELTSSRENVPFPILYTAYHHFRSKGWVVKPGIQFGANFVLYKDGPPHNHATYSVRVLSGAECRPAPSWSILSAINRTTVNAGKNVLLCYVLIPEGFKDFSWPTCIKQFKVQELLVTRWVGAAERTETSELVK